jgi:acetoin utilization protein AcuB
MTNKMPRISSVMTPFPHSIEMTASIAEARKMMRELEIRHLPVVDNGVLVGVVTDRDIKLALDPGLGLPADTELSVRNVCIRDPFVVDVTAALDQVLMEMAARHIGSALVTKHDRLAGIFTVTDACRHYARLLREVYPGKDGDEAA